MDSVKPSGVTPKKSRLARAFAKVLHIRIATGIAPVDGIQKSTSHHVKNIDLSAGVTWSTDGTQSSTGDTRSTGDTLSTGDTQAVDCEEKKLQNRAAVEALLAQLFASVSSIKAAYAQLQMAQTPYDADGIQSADQMVVSELQNLSELKQCYVKKQYDSSPETTLVLAEILEQKSLLKTFEITGKKLESQVKLKDSEVTFLKEKLDECNIQNRLIEKRLNSSGSLSVHSNLHSLSSLSPTHFIKVLKHASKSVRSFVRVMVNEMECAGWDFDAAATAIVSNVVYWKSNHKCFAFESFVFREMFDGFHTPNQSLPEKQDRLKRQHFFDRFTEMKSIKAADFLAQKPRSAFAKFCRVKYSRLIHPKMESSFFGNLNQRNLINGGEFFPDTPFFTSFAEMAKRVWLLHCLAFSFEPEASIFQVRSKCRFSEVYMQSVSDEAFFTPSPESDPQVGFTVVPGFIIGKTIIQCQVYLSKN